MRFPTRKACAHLSYCSSCISHISQRSCDALCDAQASFHCIPTTMSRYEEAQKPAILWSLLLIWMVRAVRTSRDFMISYVLHCAAHWSLQKLPGSTARFWPSGQQKHVRPAALTSRPDTPSGHQAWHGMKVCLSGFQDGETKRLSLTMFHHQCLECVNTVTSVPAQDTIASSLHMTGVTRREQGLCKRG